MNVDTAQFRALVGERDQLRSEAVDAGEIRGHVASIAEAVTAFGDMIADRWQPPATRRGQARHARPRGGHLRAISGGLS